LGLRRPPGRAGPFDLTISELAQIAQTKRICATTRLEAKRRVKRYEFSRLVSATRTR
jgi:hypothetical protein